MAYDYTVAPPPLFELIPEGTAATVSIHIRAGGVGEDGMLKRSAKGDCEMLHLEFTVLDGTYKGRKFWEYLILEGESEGQKKMPASSIGTLKAILDSALGLKPDDVSPEARAKRTVELRQFEGMSFIAKVGIEKGGPKKDGGNYDDKNTLAGVITRDKKEWHSVEQPPPFDMRTTPASAPSTPAAAPVARPGWA
jgi:hypothetical protein